MNETTFQKANKIKFEVPVRPKQKVKRVLEGWVNIYKCSIGHIHPTKEEAIKTRTVYDVVLGEPLFIRHEYEVEE